MIRYFIRHYWRYLAMALAFATITFLINSCEVKAESISDSMITTNNLYSTNNSNWYQMNYNTFHTIQAGSNLYLTIQATIQPSGYNQNNTTLSENMYGRVTICSDVAWTGGWNINGSSNVNFVNTKIPCYFTGSSYIGKVTFATFEFSNVLSNPLGLFGQADFASYSSTLGSYQFIATEFSFNMFPLYSENSLLYSELDNILGAINTLQSYLSTINTNITNSTNTIGNIINTNANSIVNTINIDSQAIINNNNTNTQSIIDKINEILSQNNVCNYYDKKNIGIKGKGLNNNGSESTSSVWNISEYIQITNKSKITKISERTSGYYLCFYNFNKVLISCIAQNDIELNTSINIPNNASYFRFTIREDENAPQFQVCDTTQNITNQQNEQIIQSNTDINNSINDSSIDDPDNDLLDMENQVASNSVISDLLLLPINMFQRIVNSISGTCSSFNLGTLWGSNLTMPCINIENLIGSNLWGVIDILFCGIFVLSIRKKFVDIFENITSLKDRGNELE